MADKKIVHLFSLLIFSLIMYDGWCDDVIAQPENCLCKCEQSLCDLEEFVKDLYKRLSIASEKIAGLVTLHSTFRTFQRKNAFDLNEIRRQLNKLSKQHHSDKNNSPSSQALTAEPESAVVMNMSKIITSSSTLADEAAGKKENLSTWIEEVNDKFEEVKSLTTEVTELQHENKVLKEEMEKEKRVTRSLQEELNQTQFLVIEINERVSEKDSRNSTIDEVAEIVFAKIAEYDALNKTAIENQLKKLEYTVKDVFKNETHLVQRLDSVENASAYTVGLLENGTLVEKVHSIASTIQILEKVQSQQKNSVSQLEQLMSNVNDSVSQKLRQVASSVSAIDSSTTETMLLFANELSRINDTWNNKSFAVDKTISDMSEKFNEMSNEVENVVNITKDVEVFFQSVYPETLGNLSTEVQKEIEVTQIRLQELTQLSNELGDIKSILHNTSYKDELYELWTNVTEQNKELRLKTFALLSDMSDTVNNTAGKIVELEREYVGESDRIKRYLNGSSSMEQQAKDMMENLSVEFQTLKSNQSTAFILLESRLGDLSTKMEEIDQHNFSSIVHDVSRLRDLQMESVHTTSRKLEDMQELLMKQIREYKEEIVHLMDNLEASINSTRQGDEDDSSFSRLRISVGGNPTEAETTSEVPLPCSYVPTAGDDELVTAHFRDGVYEELTTETMINHGKQLIFSCKKIGTFVLFGTERLTCMNGHWSDELPRCEKLTDESVIRDAVQVGTDPCLKPRGQFPHPSDCTKFFNCWDGQKTATKCPAGLHFNAASMTCEYPSSANCSLKDPKAKLRSLLDITPPILTAPFQVDAVESHLATSVTGELLIYPGTTVSLLCLYPRELGEPQWEINDKVPHPHIPAWDTSGTLDIKDAYKLQLTITNAGEGDSGKYTCISPKGHRHTIPILVKAIDCPEFVIDSGSPLSVSYTPNSKDPEKVMTTQASFDCLCGFSLNGSSNATCKASGTWSQDLPSCRKENIEGCTKLDLNLPPGLLIKPERCSYAAGEMVLFMCRNGADPIGITSTRCLQGGRWSANDLPHCT